MCASCGTIKYHFRLFLQVSTNSYRIIMYSNNYHIIVATKAYFYTMFLRHIGNVRTISAEQVFRYAFAFWTSLLLGNNNINLSSFNKLGHAGIEICHKRYKSTKITTHTLPCVYWSYEVKAYRVTSFWSRHR